jgi:hypothetical protein
LLDEFLVEIHATGQDHIPNGALVLFVTIGVDGDFLPEGKGRGGVLGVVAVGLPLLRAVDSAEADTSARWLCRTAMVSPSRIETTWPEKSATAREGLNRKRR